MNNFNLLAFYFKIERASMLKQLSHTNFVFDYAVLNISRKNMLINMFMKQLKQNTSTFNQNSI